jgi:hypothetical protein
MLEFDDEWLLPLLELDDDGAIEIGRGVDIEFFADGDGDVLPDDLLFALLLLLLLSLSFSSSSFSSSSFSLCFFGVGDGVGFGVTLGVGFGLGLGWFRSLIVNSATPYAGKKQKPRAAHKATHPF